MSTSDISRAAVIGAGLTGITTAYNLARRGCPPYRHGSFSLRQAENSERRTASAASIRASHSMISLLRGRAILHLTLFRSHTCFR